MIYFTSDLHLSHNKEFIYHDRGFETIHEHNCAIISNINEVVSEDDELYILGDLCLGGGDPMILYYNRQMLNMIKCKNIHVICGNHDTDSRISMYSQVQNIGADNICFSCIFKYHKYNFILSHYPMITENFDYDKPLRQRVFCLCGHTHTSDKYQNMVHGSYNVGLDAHNCYPVSIETIIDDIKAFF